MNLVVPNFNANQLHKLACCVTVFVSVGFVPMCGRILSGLRHWGHKLESKKLAYNKWLSATQLLIADYYRINT